MKNLLFCLLASLFIMSCGDDDAAPVLTVTSDNPSTVMAGVESTFLIGGTVSDDIGVKSLTITGSPELSINESISGADLEASSNSFALEITIPATVQAGEYPFTLTLTDTTDQIDTEEITLNVQ